MNVGGWLCERVGAVVSWEWCRAERPTPAPHLALPSSAGCGRGGCILQQGVSNRTENEAVVIMLQPALYEALAGGPAGHTAANPLGPVTAVRPA